MISSVPLVLCLEDEVCVCCREVVAQLALGAGCCLMYPCTRTEGHSVPYDQFIWQKQDCSFQGIFEKRRERVGNKGI